jgi:signal transduction histidine kinase
MSHIKDSAAFWRFIWILPVFFFTVTVMTSSYLNDKDKGIEFIIIRVVIYFAMLLICYLLEKAIRQIAEAETAKREAEELSRQTEFYRRMSHKLRTPLTKISTNIQMANRREETDHERLTKSQDEIMRIADMINKALDGGGESGADV